MTNLEEFNAFSDPTDYFNGEAHEVVKIEEPEEIPDTVDYGQVIGPYTVQVVSRAAGKNGTPLPNAPISLTLTGGEAKGTKLSLWASGGFAQVSFPNLRTTSDGTITFWHVMPSQP